MLRYIVSLICIFLFPLLTKAQFCTGTLGDNIFLEGDFGIGSANVLSPNPNIAPGYNYTFAVPPIDGNYVITNSTAVWSGLWPSWLRIGDNSSNPNGYMMVVNASHEPGLFYQQTINGLCENTLFEFSADIINLIKVGTPDHLTPNVSFLLDGVELFSTGNIPQTDMWTTYGATFTTQPGQQSLTLSLRNNAPGGFGNDLAIDNISFRACGPETSVAPVGEVIYLCEDANPIELQSAILGNQYVNPAFQWQASLDENIWVGIPGATESSFTHPPLPVGKFYYRFVVADGIENLESDKCRVNSDAKLIEVVPKEVMQRDTICEGLTLMVGTSSYVSSGIYRDTLVSSLGCDSVLITDLTVRSAPDFMADLSVTLPCPNVANGSIVLENVNGGTAPYSYFFEGEAVGTMAVFSELAGGVTYSVAIQDAIGCVIERSAFVENPTDLFVDIGIDQMVELGESVDVRPVYNFTPTDFSWQSTTPVDCPDLADCAQLDFIPTTSQQLQLDLMTEAGCTISDSIFIEVLDVRKVYVPNVFSPNADGINDYFMVYGDLSNVAMVEEFQIFNRWGAGIFDRSNFLPNDLQDGWDGTFKGQAMLPGVYVYTASVRFVDGLVLRYSGDLFLVR